MKDNKEQMQRVWGAALILMGIAMIFAIPQRMEQIGEIPQFSNVMWFIRFCFYFIAVALVVGGGKKILQIKKKDDI